MRNTDELMGELMQRADGIREKRSMRKQLVGYAIAVAACVVLLIVVSAFLPKISETASANEAQHYGSLILATPYMGYVAIGVIAFGLGICLTLLCSCWRAMNRRNRTAKESDAV